MINIVKVMSYRKEVIHFYIRSKHTGKYKGLCILVSSNLGGQWADFGKKSPRKGENPGNNTHGYIGL